LKKEDIDMAEVVRTAAELFRPLAEDKGVVLTCHVSDNAPFQGDTRLIQRMVANLLDNAIKYTSRDGSVEITAQTDGEGSLAVSVSDTGIGISKKDLTRIFERFYRVDPSRAHAGNGLGLSLARAIAYAHGGRIDVASTPERGSTFTVRLPVSPRNPA
jgi:signal transduction histidine kinase